MDITIPDLSRDADRGQVGIETLIIFIAMILVAAIAASVLINTAGYLQNQASATSEDSEAQVSNQVLVISSIGEISTETEESTGTPSFTYDNSANVLTYDDTNSQTFWSGNGTITITETDDSESTDYVTVWTDEQDTIEPGDTIDLNDAIDTSGADTVSVEWNPDNDTAVSSTMSDGTSVDLATNLVVKEPLRNQIGRINMTVMQSPGANEIDLEGASVEYIGPDGEATLGYSESIEVGSFAVEGTTDPDNTVPVLTDRQDRFTITVDLADESDNDLRDLEEGEEATVRIVTQSGSQAVTVVNVPQSLSSYNDEDAVEL
ncbi:archaellin/type IV pilin N-terminal domain-containing protein [Natronoarchaeum rubrum]|uniref:archaellin/type IV pilin N-terminal domain-containing protein n=1 Tax=Natronoarchaeum rubrum TaxID=755311 RepID=UPI0028739851|nr:archaellin/type IV pilin N-terminal domain-containing protein [Natronoarchaeum rubrum]